MADAADSVAPDESVLRKIVKAPGFYDPQKSPPIERGAFTPNRNDVDGLSFFLEREMSIEAMIESAAPRPASELVVIRLHAKDVYALGLTLRRTFNPGDLPGHVIIPEINWNDYQTRKTALKPLIVQLVHLAEKNIVFYEAGPGGD
jgi:hypothetical protein